MKKLSAFLCVMIWGFALPGASNAATLDFEDTGLQESDRLTTQISGLAFTDTILSKVGGPMESAFHTNTGEVDTVLDGSFGSCFISDHNPNGHPHVEKTIDISFDDPIFDLSFYAADIDSEETLTAYSYDAGNNLLEVVTLAYDDPRGWRWYCHIA